MREVIEENRERLLEERYMCSWKYELIHKDLLPIECMMMPSAAISDNSSPAPC